MNDPSYRHYLSVKYGVTQAHSDFITNRQVLLKKMCFFFKFFSKEALKKRMHFLKFSMIFLFSALPESLSAEPPRLLGIRKRKKPADVCTGTEAGTYGNRLTNSQQPFQNLSIEQDESLHRSSSPSGVQRVEFR